MNVRVVVDVPLKELNEKMDIIRPWIKGKSRHLTNRVVRDALKDLLYQSFLDIEDDDFKKAAIPYIRWAMDQRDIELKRERERRDAKRKERKLP